MKQNVVKLKQDNFISKNATAISIAGVASVVLGGFGLMDCIFTGVLAMEYLGLLMVAVGVFQFFQIFRRTSWDKRFTSLVLSALYVVSGAFIAANPLDSAEATTLFLGYLFIVSGITKLIMTLELGPVIGKAWMYFSALTSVVLGGLIVSSWPDGSADLIGFMISIELISSGVTFLSAGTALRESEKILHGAVSKIQDKLKKVA